MENLISVIVPIYKVEKYLSKCIDSILNQTYRNLEIILINDGSPDRCGLICDEYKEKDSRIKVIHKKNGGLSSARNAGLNICKGDYIAFVDSDDYIESCMYEELLSDIKQNNSQIAIAEVMKVNEGEKIIRKTQSKEVEVMDKVEAMSRYLLGEWIAVWDKLYSKELFNEIRFPIGKLNEDEAIMLKLFDKCNVITFNKKVMYYYLNREGSITKTKVSLKNNFDWVENAKENLNFINLTYPQLKEEAEKRYLGSVIWSLHSIEYCESKIYDSEKKILQKELRKNFIKVITNSYISKIDKISSIIMILNISRYKKIREMISRIKNNNKIQSGVDL